MGKITRRVRNFTFGTFGLVAVLLLAGIAYQALATQRDVKHLRITGELHSVNGKSLQIHCVGSGGPAVIFEAGAGAWSAHWSHVQAQLADMGRICTYDRAGLGWSQASPQPMTGQDYVRDLHDLLLAS